MQRPGELGSNSSIEPLSGYTILEFYTFFFRIYPPFRGRVLRLSIRHLFWMLMSRQGRNTPQLRPILMSPKWPKSMSSPTCELAVTLLSFAAFLTNDSGASGTGKNLHIFEKPKQEKPCGKDSIDSRRRVHHADRHAHCSGSRRDEDR